MNKSTAIELVVTDLDGTLWGPSGRIHPESLRALSALADQGVPVLAATARRPASARKALADNGIVLPAVLFDGSLGRDLRDGGEFHREAFDPQAALRVLTAFLDVGIEPCVNVAVDGDRDARFGRRPSSHPLHVANIAPWSEIGELTDVVRDIPVLSFQLSGMPREPLDLVAQQLSAFASCSVAHDVKYGGFAVSARPRGSNKWRGVEAFCSTHDLDSGAVLAAGDGVNDLELLTHARRACAVQGGSDVVLAAADHVLGEPDLGGWATVLDLVL